MIFSAKAAKPHTTVTNPAPVCDARAQSIDGKTSLRWRQTPVARPPNVRAPPPSRPRAERHRSVRLHERRRGQLLQRNLPRVPPLRRRARRTLSLEVRSERSASPSSCRWCATFSCTRATRMVALRFQRRLAPGVKSSRAFRSAWRCSTPKVPLRRWDG